MPALQTQTGVQLTRAGKQLTGQGKDIILAWEQLKADVHKKEDTVSGQFIIGCHPSLALNSLGHFLPQLIHEYPDLEIKLWHDHSRRITDAVINFEVDFGIVVNPVRHPDLVIKELCTDTVTFWTIKQQKTGKKSELVQSTLICDFDLIQTQKLLADLQKKRLTIQTHNSNRKPGSHRGPDRLGCRRGYSPKSCGNKSRAPKPHLIGRKIAQIQRSTLSCLPGRLAKIKRRSGDYRVY